MLERIEKNYGKIFRIGAVILFVVGLGNFLFAVVSHNMLEYRDKTRFGQFFLSYKYLSIWANTGVVVYCILRCVMIPVLIYKKAFFSEDYQDLGTFIFGLSRLIVYIQVSIVYPFGLLSFMLFWLLHTLNPAFVINRCESDALEPPNYLKHLLHTCLIVFIILDLILTKRKYPKDRYCLAVLFGFGLTFVAWLHVVYASTSKWSHGILDQLSTGLRWLFIIGMFTPAPIFFYTAKILDFILWRVFEEKEEKITEEPPTQPAIKK